MTYALSGALQAAVYDLLQSDPGLTALIGDAVFDAVPGGSLPETYVLLGQEVAKDLSDPQGAGAEHRLTLSDLLHGAEPALSRGHVVDMAFLKATARPIDGASARQIDLQFRARVADA
jgi:hypothetical protein